MSVQYLTKDGVTVKKGDTVYHPLYTPIAIVIDGLNARIPNYDIVPIIECYADKKNADGLNY